MKQYSHMIGFWSGLYLLFSKIEIGFELLRFLNKNNTFHELNHIGLLIIASQDCIFEISRLKLWLNCRIQTMKEEDLVCVVQRLQ
jgi:hypothetical protein